MGYSEYSKAFRVYNKKTLIVEESIHVFFYESPTTLSDNHEMTTDIFNASMTFENTLLPSVSELSLEPKIKIAPIVAV